LILRPTKGIWIKLKRRNAEKSWLRSHAELMPWKSSLHRRISEFTTYRSCALYSESPDLMFSCPHWWRVLCIFITVIDVMLCLVLVSKVSTQINIQQVSQKRGSIHQFNFIG
jgi:uncharacterized membrane protein YhdT